MYFMRRDIVKQRKLMADSNKNVLINATCWANSYSTYALQESSTAFKTFSIAFSQENLRGQNPAENFLASSYMRRNDRARDFSISSYFGDTGMQMLQLIDEEDAIAKNLFPLSEGVPLTMEIGEVMIQRRSIRHYTGDPMEFDYLSSLIRAAAGITATNQMALSQGGSLETTLRTVASGGGLYPVKLYVVACSVNGLEPGIYRFASKKDALIQVDDASGVESFFNCYSAAPGIISTDKASAVLLLIGHPWRSMRKYGNKGLRFVFQEAGAMTQNIHLAATSLGLGSVDCASFYDEEIHDLLQMDGINQFFLHAIFIGMPG